MFCLCSVCFIIKSNCFIWTEQSCDSKKKLILFKKKICHPNEFNKYFKKKEHEKTFWDEGNDPLFWLLLLHSCKNIYQSSSNWILKIMHFIMSKLYLKELGIRWQAKYGLDHHELTSQHFNLFSTKNNNS